MNDTEKTKMNLNIGGNRISVTVPFSSQDFVRDVEESVNKLYDSWRREFPKKSDREVLAMVAYQYASHYAELVERHSKAMSLTDKARQIADRILEDPGPDKVPDIPDVGA